MTAKSPFPDLKFVLAGVTAFALLTIFIGWTHYKKIQSLKQTTDGAIFPKEHCDTIGMISRTLAMHDFESGNAADTASHLVVWGHRGSQSLRMNSYVQFSPGLGVRFGELKPADSSWIRVTGFVWFSCAPEDVKCSLVTTCNRSGYNYKYTSLPLEKATLKQRVWNRISVDYRLPHYHDPDDLIQAYFWYRGIGEMWVDDIDVVYYSSKKFVK